MLRKRSVGVLGSWLVVSAMVLMPLSVRAVGGDDVNTATKVPMLTQKCQEAVAKGLERYAVKASMAMRGCLGGILKCDEASDATKALTCRRSLLKASGKCSAVKLDEDLSMIGAGAALAASGAPTSRATLRKEMNLLTTQLGVKCVTPGAELGDADTGLGFDPEPPTALALVDALNADPGGVQCLANGLVLQAYPLADAIVDVVEPLHETCIAGPTLGASCTMDSECGTEGVCGKLARVFREGSIKACAGTPPVVAVCGNGTAEAPEQCDDGDLQDLDGCSSTCTLEPSHQVVATGQTTCWNSAGSPISCAGTGHDGESQAGAALAYVDNGDGTITDVNSGLMWEKLDDNNVGGIHEQHSGYSWANAFAIKIAALNAGGGFAGYTDWRVPNIKELQSIMNYQLTPAISPAFHNGCVPGCTVLTCSCTTTTASVWSSTNSVLLPNQAWFAGFPNESMGISSKGVSYVVRAVRGGL